MAQTGLGPGIGEIKYVAPATSATSQYRTQLESMGVSSGDIFTSPATAFAAMEANRNDVMLVAPGAYDIDTELAWSKDYTHLIGLGGPNQGGDFSLPGVAIYTDNVATVETIDCTGDYCQFHNANISNYGNNLACLSAFNLDGYGCAFKSVSFQGTMTAGNDDVVAAASLYIDQLGHFPLFEDCIIGQNAWDVREGANSGVLRFVGTTAPAPQNGVFRRCSFLSASETATVAMVALPANTCLDRVWIFDKCHFDNFSVNAAVTLNQVFYDVCGTTHTIQLNGCTATGFTEWETSAGRVFQSMPVASVTGGIALQSA